MTPQKKITIAVILGTIGATAIAFLTLGLLSVFTVKEPAKIDTEYFEEPKTVVTPPSKEDFANAIVILITPDGEVALDLRGMDKAKRDEICRKAFEIYNEQNPGSRNDPTVKEYLELATSGLINKEFKNLNNFSSQSDSEARGIPYDDNQNLDKPNQLQIWLKAIQESSSEEMKEAIEKGNGLVIKTDPETEYETVSKVLNNLQAMGMNHFTLSTRLKDEE